MTTPPTGSVPSVRPTAPGKDTSLAGAPLPREKGLTPAQIREAIVTREVTIAYQEWREDGAGVVTLKIGPPQVFVPATVETLETMLREFPKLGRKPLGIRWHQGYADAIKVLKVGGFLRPQARGEQYRYVDTATPGAIRAFLRERRAVAQAALRNEQ